MIELKNVSFTYKQDSEKNALHGINLTIHSGEVVVLCGVSGCGKTTMTRLINGLIPNYYEGLMEGAVFVGGQDVSCLPLYETAKTIGSVFQNPRSQFFNVDTRSEIAFGCENQGLPADEILRRVDGTIEALNLKKLMDRSIFQLSGGEKQMIACASVTASDPEIYVLDEPSSNLDMAAIDELRTQIRYWKRQRKTIIIAEHRLHYLCDIADRIIYMKDGKIEEEFTVNQLEALSTSSMERMGLRAMLFKNIANDAPDIESGTDVISISKFTFAYNNRPVINIDALTIPRNSVIAVIGHNGAGKSTFARCLCGLEKNCQSTLKIGGKEFKRKDKLKHCYLVMQDVNHQLFTESVLDEVLLSMASEDIEKAERILFNLDLLTLKDLHPMSLSGGQKQRVAIASAIASQREIIIFDEPTSGLDLYHMHEVADNFNALRKLGKTLFIITHDLELILKCCNYVIYLDGGEILDHYNLDSCGVIRLMNFFNIDIEISGLRE
jgi:energy-coupling factor transporter ATP-binding protein EcfA2